MLKLLTGKVIMNALFVALTGVTVVSGAGGVYKLVKTAANYEPAVPAVQSVANAAVNANGSVSPTQGSVLGTSTTVRTTTGTGLAGTAGLQTAAQAQTGAAATTGTNSASTAAATTSNACIITLFGLQYDVTSLKSTHTGGDIYQCGTDMTALYQSVHGTNVARMAAYLVTSSGSGNSGGGTTGSGSGSGGSTTGSGTGSTTGGGTTSGGGSTSGSGTGSTASACIITLFGKQYNVAPLITSSGGGSIFQCGTDMTTVYQSVHGTDVSIMAPYLVTGSGSGSGTGSGSGSTSGSGGSTGTTGGNIQGDDDDNDENEIEEEHDTDDIENDNEDEHEEDEQWEQERSEMEHEWEQARDRTEQED